jgi:transcription elongation factor Elf1
MNEPAKKDYPFRVLCKRCNSYLHTTIELADNHVGLRCRKCGNSLSHAEECFSEIDAEGLRHFLRRRT